MAGGACTTILVLLNAIWLSGLHSYIDDTPSSFSHIISLAASAIYSALLEHSDGMFRVVEFLPAKSKDTYMQVLSLLCHPIWYEQLNLLKEKIRDHGHSLVNT